MALTGSDPFAYEIIRRARPLPQGEKQAVIVLGALTHVASALLIDPGIESRLAVYWLDTFFDFENQVSKRLDFNAVMDLQATEIMLTSRGSLL